MGRNIEYTILGPSREIPGGFPAHTKKTLPIRRDHTAGSLNLRAQYRNAGRRSRNDPIDPRPNLAHVLTSTPNLPPTPPAAGSEKQGTTVEDAPSEAGLLRSAPITPINQHSPPTPDDTPPRERNLPFRRPFLEGRLSMASTMTESFKTAREDMGSEDDSEERHSARPLEDRLHWSSSPNRRVGGVPHYTPSRVSTRSPLIGPLEDSFPVAVRSGTGRNISHTQPDPKEHVTMMPEKFTKDGNPLQIPVKVRSPKDGTGRESPPDTTTGSPMTHGETTASPQPLLDMKMTASDGVGRGTSLRDRLLEAQSRSPSASAEKFATIIGWNNSVSPEPVRENSRLSGVSTTSTVEAFVVEQTRLPKRKTTLRHVGKNESLRSASSPLPISTGSPLISTSESAHRLVHKKARLNNQHRWSTGSEVSRSFSLASSAVLPKTEIIRVAVIPERKSSLQSTPTSSQRQSISTTSAKSNPRRPLENPPSAWQRRRGWSESVDQGREPTQPQPPVVPPRRSSLSAPTSRSTSRANSISSERLHIRREEAETDLRKTLNRMESERLRSSLQRLLQQDPLGRRRHTEPQPSHRLEENDGPAVNSSAGAVPFSQFDGAWSHSADVEHPSARDSVVGIVPGSQEWAALRPPSILETPFSQPSFQSASPEINEARAINFFPHNNHSLQLIEPNTTPESRAVQEVRKQQIPEVEVDSPLRNPRRPPEPPQLHIIPPTPAHELDRPLGLEDGLLGGRLPSVRRHPSLTGRRRSESFVTALSRGFSLKNARNRKADQDLDSSLHPFWRPRAFWDDADPSHEQDDRSIERSLDDGTLISNSLGLPQQRTVITGPVSLVRRISERRRQKRGLAKQSSHGSLARFRASRRLYQMPRLGMHFQFVGLKDIQEYVLNARRRKDDERREKRRADLRRSIGVNVVSQSDSRFPASTISFSNAA